MRKAYLFLVLVVAISCNQDGEIPSLKHKVGYIELEDAIDPDPDFSPCGSEDSILEYYNKNSSQDRSAGYNGGTSAIAKYLEQHYPQLDLAGESGMFTVRFIVNCEGKTGRFETFSCDLDYQSKRFDAKVSDQLLAITRELRDWHPNQNEGETRDSFAFLIYRIENGKITAILP